MKRAAVLFPLLLSVLFGSAGRAQSEETRPPFSATIEKSQQSLAEAKAELEAARRQIADEQRPQLRAFSSLQGEVATLRRERQQLTAETEGARQGIAALEKQVAGSAARLEASQYRLLYLRRAFEENLPAIERADFQPRFLAYEKIGDATADDRVARMKALFEIADAALERADAHIGGFRRPANALVDSVSTEGTALQFGPYAFFAPQDGPAGLVVEGEDLSARVRILKSNTGQSIADALAGREAILPFDPLLDQAFLNADAEVSLWEHLKSGGLWIIPITLFGLVSLVIAILKILQTRGIRAPEREQINGLLAARDDADFEDRLSEVTPLARPIFAEGYAFRGAPEVARAAAMSQVILTFRSQLESRLSLLALTAAVAPLLGLLGTVTGMIKTFQVISLHGAGDARTLSGGISEALVTTELGLVVAIPALLAHAWLNRRAKQISIQTASLADRYHKSLPLGSSAP